MTFMDYLTWHTREYYYCICPHCGRISGQYVKDKPVCDCCGYDNVLKFTTDEQMNQLRYIDRSVEIEKENPGRTTEEYFKMVEEEYREKYVYNSPVFDKDLNEKRIAYDKQRDAELEEYGRKNRAEAEAEEHRPKPHCPTCNSTNVKKISAGAKAVSVGLFGIFSQKVKHQFHCNNCGYEW